MPTSLLLQGVGVVVGITQTLLVVVERVVIKNYPHKNYPLARLTP
jgi:hypothetical protein